MKILKFKNFVTALLAIVPQAVYSQTSEDVEAWPHAAKVFSRYGYDWEPYQVQTEDGW